MARVTENGISGRIGPVVYYMMNGKQYARSKPVSSKGTKAKKRTALTSLFGLVSKYGTMMVKYVKDNNCFYIPFGRTVYNNLRGWMRNQYAANQQEESWELSVRASGMCQMAEGIDLRDFWKTGITVTDNGSGNILIDLPEFNPKKDLKVPLRTMKVNLKLIAVTSPFKEAPVPCTLCKQQFSFEYSSSPVPAQQFVLQTDAGTGDIALVLMGLEFETTDSGNGMPLKDIRWLPTAAIAMGKLK